LPLSLARHVLTLEAAHRDGWLGRLGLVEALDAYMANAQGDAHLRIPVPQPRPVIPGNGKKISEVNKLPANKALPVLNKPVPVQQSNIGRRCYICSSPNHISTTSPQRSINGTNKPQLKPRINACVAQMAESVGERNSPQMNVDKTQGAELSSSTPLGPVTPLQSQSRSKRPRARGRSRGCTCYWRSVCWELSDGKRRLC